jgi:hypothetical protein
MPAAVAASKETGTRSSAVNARRVAGIDRDTNGRSSVQVFGDGPRGGALSDQQGRSCYDYDADHDSISFCSWFSIVLFIPELPDQKNSLYRINCAFQHLEIDRGKLLGDILEHPAHHFGPGGMPLPSHPGNFRAHRSPVGWIIDPFH